MKTCPNCQAAYPDNIAFCARDGAQLRAAGTWAAGALVRGRYRILDKIGEGGMGAVYKATHTGFDELRAIKVLNADLTGDENIHQRFKQEAYITRKLRHPNAVHVDDIDEAEDGSPFIVMEYIEGKSLKQVLKEGGPLPPRRVCAIAKQVAAALDAAHQLGMVHRDIKPDNIVLVATPGGETAKVLDFGIASLTEAGRGDSRKMDLTGVGFVVGTPLYVSPEQAQGKRGDDLDGRSDLYSLGIVMYQMLTGEVPFKSDTAMDLLIAQIQKTPDPIRRVRPDLNIPEPLANLVMQLLQKNRELRPASAAALMDELTRVERGMPVPASPFPLRPGGAAPAPPRPVAASAPPAPQAAPPPYVSRPTPPPATQIEERPPLLSLQRVISLIVVAGIIAFIWYHTTHRPSDEIARHQAAAIEFEQQKLYPQAEQEYRAAVQLDPSNAALQSALGHVLVEQRKWDDAISTLRAAVALQPEDAVTHNNLGVALVTVGDAGQAIPEFRDAIRNQPDFADAHSNLGNALEKQNDFNDSIAEYREVLRIKPDDAEAHFHVGQVQYKQGNVDNAVDEYREAIRLRPGFALAHFSLGGALYNRGDHDGGISELRTAYTLSPDDPEIRAAYQKLLEK